MTATTRSTVAGLVWVAITAVALVAALFATREPAPAPMTVTVTTTVTTPVAPCNHEACPPWPSLDY